MTKEMVFLGKWFFSWKQSEEQASCKLSECPHLVTWFNTLATTLSFPEVWVLDCFSSQYNLMFSEIGHVVQKILQTIGSIDLLSTYTNVMTNDPPGKLDLQCHSWIYDYVKSTVRKLDDVLSWILRLPYLDYSSLHFYSSKCWCQNRPPSSLSPAYSKPFWVSNVYIFEYWWLMIHL